MGILFVPEDQLLRLHTSCYCHNVVHELAASFQHRFGIVLLLNIEALHHDSQSSAMSHNLYVAN